MFDLDRCFVCGSRSAPMHGTVFQMCVSRRKCRRRAKRKYGTPNVIRGFYVAGDFGKSEMGAHLALWELLEGENQGEGGNWALASGESPETT